MTSSGIRSKADKHDIHTSCGFKQIFKNYNNWSKFLSIFKLGLWIFDFLFIQFFLAGHLSIPVFILKAEKSYPYKIKVYLLTHLLDLNSNLNDGVFEKKLIP